jgi:phosphomannomutase
MTDLDSRTKAWLEADPDPETRAQLQALLASDSTEELSERMGGTLEFGTAGIRGVVEAGSNRMNRAVVIRTTAGLVRFLQGTTAPEDRLVAVGRDARPSSASFMEDTVGVLVAAGFRVLYFSDPTPTPLVAYAGLSSGACASIVITASHNPPADNGYKVYASNGAQIVGPTDVEIAAEIEEVGPANQVPRAADAYGHPDSTAIGPDLFDQYLRDVAADLPGQSGDRSLSIVYSAMHGVGGRFVTEALKRFGFNTVRPVARQFEPDGTFPTVAFPNPEEPGAMDMAHELAEAVEADLVLANDPDTDRLAVSVPEPGGAWRALSGNQIGCLLAEFLLSADGRGDGPVINSIVSTPMLGSIAEAHGVVWAQTLTGFKWVCNAAIDLAYPDSPRMILGFEEALGYSVGTTVRDKDGISAAVAFAALAAAAHGDNATVMDRLGDLYATYGVWTSAQVSIRREGSDGIAEIASAMAALRSDPPTAIGTHTVTHVVDYSTGGSDRPRYLGETNLIALQLGGAGRVLARPSGTEPKLKVYVDLTTGFPDSGDWIGTEIALNEEATALGQELADWLS